MGEKSVSIKLLSIFILGICLLWNTGSETGIHAGPNNIQKGQAAAKKKSDPVDLSIQSFTLSKTKIQPGATISMQYRIRLKGKLKTGTYVDIYLTSQRHKYSSKNRIFRRTIKSSHFDGSGIVHLQKYHKFPLTHRTGTFYLFLVVDGSNDIKEWDERNNTVVRTLQIKRESTSLSATRPEVNPDVGVEQLEINPQVVKDDEPLKVSFYVTNPGKVIIAEVGYRVSIRVKGGMFTGFSALTLKKGLCRNLLPGNRKAINLNVNIPLNIKLPPQPDDLYVRVDYENKLKEKHTDWKNNLAVVPIHIKITKQPDLRISQFNLDLAGSSRNILPKGRELNFDLKFKNVGTRKSGPCRYRVRIHFWKIYRDRSGASTSAKWLRIESRSYDIHQLEPNEIQRSSLRFASGSWERGRYRIQVFADSKKQIVESNENNNEQQRYFEIR